MVSTRSVRYKFSEGERVLCYEPDPTKAKVLYDSKVLEVIESKDKRGRRTVEYLIHFQGWNSSWDRCVSEDFVLKDTEENRQLQRDLAEKSQLQLGAYLYRRERKKGNSTNSGSGPAKRPRHGFSDDGSSSSTQPDPDEGETVDTDSSSGSGSSTQPNSPPNSNSGRASIILPSALRDRLTFDYHLVVKRGRLSRLPASPCAAQILESYVKWFARSGAWNPPRARQDPPQKPDMLEVSCRLNLLREVADGLRVYFDFILQGHLLYKQEIEQYYEYCGQFNDEFHYIYRPDIKSEPDDDDDDDIDDDDEDEENRDPEAVHDEAMMEAIEEDLTSPKIPEYSHLPPDPEHGENGEESAENNEFEPEEEDEAEVEEQAESEGEQENEEVGEQENEEACEDDDEEAMEQEIEEATEQESEEATEQGSEEATEQGSEEAIEQGSDEAIEQGNEEAIEQGSDEAIEQGSEEATEQGSEEATEQGSEEATEQGSEEATEQGSEEATEQGSDEARERANEEARSSPRTEDGSRHDAKAAPRSHSLARRLRSHKSAVSQSENEEPAPSTSTGEQRTFETLSSSVGSSGSSMSEGWARPARPPPAPATPARNPLSQLLDKVAKWQLIPREDTENLPCRIYGAIHLARLFVKLPDFLNATQMPDFKLKLVLKHIDMFVQYLDEHNEWFGEMYYISDGVSRSH